MLNALQEMGHTSGKQTSIYVAAPARVATGGPEVLHQLAYQLRVGLGCNASMYYYPPSTNDPVHPQYACYNNPIAQQIDDRPQNILIVPEVVQALKMLKRLKDIQKVIWWLSVDNFVLSYASSSPRVALKNLDIVVSHALNRLSEKVVGKQLVDVDLKEVLLRRLVANKGLVRRALQNLGVGEVRLHLCQSRYAMDFLQASGIMNTAYLLDYVNSEFLEHECDNDPCERKENIVAFNPKKGYRFTRKIIKALPSVRFVPIENLSRSEVMALLGRAKVYIDFGEHPGRDRLPREAAILGCCVIVGARGAAANGDDVPIPEKYKFQVKEENIPRIVKTIEMCLRNYADVHEEFARYREVIRNEPERFRVDVERIFGEVNSEGV